MFKGDIKKKSSKSFSMSESSVMSEGYGVVPKRVMRDKKLTPEGKAIYSYLCSFAGAGNEAFPSISLMMDELGMSKDRLHRHMSLLIETGYLRKHQFMGEDNKFGKNIYELVQEVGVKAKSKNLEIFK